MNNFCIVIPNFNHVSVIDEVLATLTEYTLPIIMVDDASSVQAKSLFATLEKKYAHLTLISHEQNEGKGGAVQTGLRCAYEQGYSHAIQVDADGQHNLSDIKKLIQFLKNYEKYRKN